ncbi:MAG: hypothetical protein J6A24_02415 [Clostridia bacterium]|nr:hypothetical protein [Clostridia bacterium]
MREFWILFKHEFKMQFPLRPQKGRFDFIGSLLSLLTTVLVAAVFVLLVSTIAENYVAVEIDKVAAPLERGKELLNLFYTIIILAMSVICMEKMRSTLTQKNDKELFLRLPVKQQTIFMSKLCTLMIWNYVLAFVLMGSVNVIFYLALKPTLVATGSVAAYWIYSVLAWLFLPMTAFLIATVLLVPYIKFIDFVSNKYVLIFLLLTAILVLAFMLYSGLLSIVQSLLETGSIKFLFNERFILTLQWLLTWTYPANCFASIVLGKDLLLSFAIVVGITVVSAAAVYLVSKSLFYATLYKNENKRQKGKRKTRFATKSPLASLMRKEFISVFRDPQHLFSYFAIATAMPVMVYCCYTLFDSLIWNALGMRINFALGLLVLLIFSILTNTFCATNVSRDGRAALNAKLFPVKPSMILLAKVLFCDIVSSLAIVASALVLANATTLSTSDAIVCTCIALVFSVAQIFIATRMDLNHAKVAASPIEMEKHSNRTVAKVVFLGLFLALLLGLLSLFITVFANMESIEIIARLNLQGWYAYAVPALGSLLYLGFAVLYYTVKLDRSFDRLLA